MEQALSQQIHQVQQDLQHSIQAFPNEQFNLVPSYGGWTAGQVAQHIDLSLNGIADIMNAPAVKAERPTDEKIPMVAGIFVDDNKKFKAAMDITPDAPPHEANDLLRSINGKLDGIRQSLDNHDVNELCSVADVPFFGTMTRNEWGHLVLYHTQRHVRQMKRIAQNLNVPV